MWDELRPGETFFLTDRELGFFLQAKEIALYLGFPLEHVPKDRTELLETLFGLTEKGFLKAEGEEFRVEKELSACLELLKGAEGVLQVSPLEEEFPQTCCYPGEELLAVQPAAFRKNTLKLWRMSWEELETLLKESGRRIKLEYSPVHPELPGWKAVVKRPGEELYLEEENGEKLQAENLRRRILGEKEGLLV